MQQDLTLSSAGGGQMPEAVGGADGDLVKADHSETNLWHVVDLDVCRRALQMLKPSIRSW